MVRKDVKKKEKPKFRASLLASVRMTACFWDLPRRSITWKMGRKDKNY